MDRTSWIAIIICVAGLIWWNYSYSQRQAERVAEYRRQLAIAQEAAAREAARTPSAAADGPSIATAPAGQPPAISPAAVPSAPSLPEETLTVTSPEGSIEYLFTSRGGIASLRLLKHLGDKRAGHPNIGINTRGDFPIGALFDAETRQTPGGFKLSRPADSPAVTLEREQDGILLRKRFSLPPADPTKDPYVTELKVSWLNRTPEAVKLPSTFLAAGEISPIHKTDLLTYTGLDYMRNGGVRHVPVTWFDAQRIPLIGIETRAAMPYYVNQESDIDWVGVRNQFYAALVTPRDFKAEGVWSRRMPITAINGQTVNGHPIFGIEGALRLPEIEIPAGGEVSRSFQIYTGPRELARLQRLEHGEAEIMNFGMFKIISEILLHSMNGLKSLTGNYALAILLLTIIIKLMLYPLQNAATIQMKRMSLLSPMMNELREKYKTNPQKMNEEVMKLYKEYGVNPFSGCLPMLIQIPIFFGFFGMLGTAVELRNSGFLWVRDLSQPDTVFQLGWLPVNILPIVMAATMFWQMHITPKTGDKMQQRIFLIMPVIFILFCYNYASALALYWTAQNIFSIVQLYLTRNQPMPELKKLQPAARVGGGGQTKRRKGGGRSLPGRPGGRA